MVARMAHCTKCKVLPLAAGLYLLLSLSNFGEEIRDF
jgi:hypothetical protein